MPKVEKINVLIIGNGHYATGLTPLEGKTDKDFGVILPSVLELRRQGLIGQVAIAGKNGSKFTRLEKKIKAMSKKFCWDDRIAFYPKNNKTDKKAFAKALNDIPKPLAVIIAVPDFLHKSMILTSIKRGGHFLVVKPAVTKLSDLKEIMAAQKKHKVLGLVDYHKAYDEANLILKEHYRDGTYGDLQHIFSKITQRRDMAKIFGQWIGRQGHNVNHYLNSHYIHLVHFITGANPLTVRTLGQTGLLKKEGLNSYDLIETQIEWEAQNKTKFVSYHLAGWNDPSETASMTYQEIHLIGTKGHVESDQRFRGYESTLVDQGQRIINPYFFYLNCGIDGSFDLDSKYGFKSIKTFIKSAIEAENGRALTSFENGLPTIKDSLKVTAILEAADQSLNNQSRVIKVKGEKEQ